MTLESQRMLHLLVLTRVEGFHSDEPGLESKLPQCLQSLCFTNSQLLVSARLKRMSEYLPATLSPMS